MAHLAVGIGNHSDAQKHKAGREDLTIRDGQNTRGNGISNSSLRSEKPLRIVFLHPDLGIGGAERLIIDAATGLQSRGHRVTIITSHCDPSHCFDEAKDGTLDVRVRGNRLIPPSLFSGRFKILCAIGRQVCSLLESCVLSGEMKELRPDVFVVDQLSAGIPVLQLLGRCFPTWITADSVRCNGVDESCPGEHKVQSSSSKLISTSTTLLHACPKVVFYCHFPDKLLVQDRSSLVRRLYRLPFDELESWSTGMSDEIVVNSQFTKEVFTNAFPRLTRKQGGNAVGWNPEIVYPCVDVHQLSSVGQRKDGVKQDRDELHDQFLNGRKVILSLNRFERKKKVENAIVAFHKLDPVQRDQAVLVIAGGYDTRVSENVEYHAWLQSLCQSLSLHSFTVRTPDEMARYLGPQKTGLAITPSISVLFLLSVPSSVKFDLLDAATLLVYTPPNEHFGIVPLEAMLNRLPVLADKSGGPLETVVDGETGWLREPPGQGRGQGKDSDNDGWTAVMSFALQDENKPVLRLMGQKGHERVVTLFTKEKMAERLEEVIYKTQSRPSGLSRSRIHSALVLLTAVVVAMSALILREIY